MHAHGLCRGTARPPFRFSHVKPASGSSRVIVVYAHPQIYNVTQVTGYVGILPLGSNHDKSFEFNTFTPTNPQFLGLRRVF
jgi:hypothetical protein